MKYPAMKTWNVRYKIYLALLTLILIAAIYLLAVKLNILLNFWTGNLLIDGLDVTALVSHYTEHSLPGLPGPEGAHALKLNMVLDSMTM